MSFPFNLWFEVNVETLEILTLHLSYQGMSPDLDCVLSIYYKQ